MSFFEYIQNKAWIEALALVNSPEFQLPDEYAHAPFHPEYSLAPNDYTMAKLFYAVLLNVKLNRPFTQVSFCYSDDSEKHVLFSPNVPLPLAILSVRIFRPASQLHQLSKIKSQLMRHIESFDLYTDKYYQHYLLLIHTEIYQLYLRELRVAEAWNQLRIIQQLDPQNAWVQDQFQKLADSVGITCDQSLENAVEREGKEGPEELSLDESLQQKKVALEQKLATCLDDEYARDIVYQNLAVVSLVTGQIEDAKKYAQACGTSCMVQRILAQLGAISQ